jgi:hypothetical protein
MTVRRAEEGSATIQTMAIILFCAAVAAGALAFIARSSITIARVSATDPGISADLVAAISEAKKAIEGDSSPDSDSPLDGGYSLTSFSGCAVMIEDASSKLNPNWIRPKMLQETRLLELLENNASPDNLMQFRVDLGLSTHTGHYSDFFTEKTAKKYLSCLSYPNINSTDEFALKRLCLEAGLGQADAEAFHSLVQGQLASLKIVDERELSDMLGLRFSALKPLITCQGQLNVNFMDGKILDDILSYPPWEIQGSSDKCVNILHSRELAAYDDEALGQVLGLDRKHVVYAYLGVRTWFWRVRAEKGGRSMTATLARPLPFDPLSNVKKKLTIISIEEGKTE